MSAAGWALLAMPVLAGGLGCSMRQRQLTNAGKGDWKITAWDTGWDMLRSAALFAAIGPLIGFCVVLPLMLVTAWPPPDGDLFAVALLVLVFGYVMGAVPALATGAAAGALLPWRRSGWQDAGMGVIGVFAALCMMQVLGLEDSLSPGSERLAGASLAFLLPAFLAGSLCSLWQRRRAA